jgi:Mrp family chromosome partitioning ATPase
MSAVEPRRLAISWRAVDGPIERGFDSTPGTVVAVCGLHGGAGTTTTAAALATAAAATSAPGRVLAVEADGRAGELAQHLGAASPWSLARLALLASAGRRPDGAPFVERDDGLRVLATAPDTQADATAEVVAVLAEAARTHGVVVVDAGSLTGRAAPVCLPAAQIVIWTARPERVDVAADRLAGPPGRYARGARWLLALVGGRPSRRALAPVRDDLQAQIVLPDEADRDAGGGRNLLRAVQELVA